MTEVLIDIETDSLDATKIHCIVAKETQTGKYHVWTGEDCYKKFPADCKQFSKFVGHKIVSFDIPILNRLTGSNIQLNQLEDTLILSQLLDPVREGGHSLGAWGNTLHYNKIDYHDFSNFSEEMLTYCKRDVDLTGRVYIHLKMACQKAKMSRRSIDLEYRISVLISKQERNGFTLDLQKAMSLVCRLRDKATQIEADLQERYLPIVEERYSDKTGKRLKDKIVIFNPASRQQIAQRLMEQGWQPNKKTEKGHPIVDESVLKEVDIPEAKIIAEYLLLQKRVSQVQSWIDAVQEDGKVHGKVLTLRAISGRMAHNSPNMAQVPAGHSPYGKECRECWTVTEPDNVLVGCDASSLELRALAHYLDDPVFTKEVVEGDIHTANQKAAGLETRDQAKTFIYAFIYGAGAAKIGSIVGGTSTDGQRLIDTFLSNVPALATFRQKVDKTSQLGYIRGLDGRRLKVRNQHAAVNLLIQGAGAVICKQWLVDITLLYNKSKLKADLVASIHDEYQFEVFKPHALAFGSLTKKAMKETERKLLIKCPLDSEYKIGNNWSETH
jgi:DNA polymerase I